MNCARRIGDADAEKSRLIVQPHPRARRHGTRSTHGLPLTQAPRCLAIKVHCREMLERRVGREERRPFPPSPRFRQRLEGLHRIAVEGLDVLAPQHAHMAEGAEPCRDIFREDADISPLRAQHLELECLRAECGSRSRDISIVRGGRSTVTPARASL